MRLHHLRLRAFGPFATEQTIDFDPLGAGGLFLLDGPTGAGKSTVLDAITFALYGPGERGGDGRLHSHFADPSVEPRVVLEFSLRGVRQRVTRTPEFPRPKRRGDGTTIQHAAVHLQRHENGQWVSRSSNKAEVGEILGDEIGLTRDQFTQVALLPQGEFMRFLRATDDDRRVLLTRLFGTQLYDRITDELERCRQVAAKELEAARLHVGTCVAAAAEAAGLDRTGRDELAECAPAERDERLAALADRLVATATGAAGAACTAGAARDENRAVAQAAVAAAQQMQALLAAGRACVAHEASCDGHERMALAVAAAERAEPVRPLLDALAEASQLADRAERALLRLEPGASPPWLRGEGADEVRDLAAASAEQAAALTHLVARERAVADLRARVEQLSAGARAAEDAAVVATARHREIPAELALVDAELRKAVENGAALDGLCARQTALAERIDALAELAVVQPARDQARKRQQRAFARYARAVDEHHRRLDARLANMAAELAGALREGERCPVCGANEHPVPARSEPDSVTAEDVTAAADARARAEEHREARTTELSELERRLHALRLTADGGDAPTLRAGRIELAAAIREARRDAARRDALVQTKQALELEQRRLAAVRTEAERAAARLGAEFDGGQRALFELQSELIDAADGHPSVAARQQQLRRCAEVDAELAAALDSLANARAARTTAAARAAGEAGNRGFADVDTARAAAMPREQYQTVRAKLDTWRSMRERLRGALVEAERSGLDPADAAAVLARAEQARHALAESESDAEHAAVRSGRAANAEERFMRAQADVADACRRHAELDAESAPVVYLARLAKGVSGQRRVALTTYVLRQWFERVVGAANIRLSGMSGARYELVRVDEGTSRSERTGLTLQVLDRHTGAKRSTRSLSGGETFYTSLSLALGLADVVRAEAGGVDLDTLFIDEGFGSLDSDTLDQVMAVIDELRERGRTVGIVSHVSELKDRIAERIEVRRLPDGSSTLRVVA